MNKLNERQKTFVQKHVKEGKSLGVAYAEAYNRPADKASYNMGSRLLDNVGIQSEVEKVRSKIEKKSDWAFEKLLKLVEDNKTPANVKEKILSNILSRSGLDAAQKVETTEKPYIEGLDDEQSVAEIAQEFLSKKGIEMSNFEGNPHV